MSKLFFVLISLITSMTHATNVDNLYEAQAEITSQDEQERQELIPTILQYVFFLIVSSYTSILFFENTGFLNTIDRSFDASIRV